MALLKKLLSWNEKTFQARKNTKDKYLKKDRISEFAKLLKIRMEFRKVIETTIGTRGLRTSVQIPKGEELNEWFALNSNKYWSVISISVFKKAVDFYHQINLLYGSITEFCTTKTCPIMNAGPKYLWADGKDIKKPVRVSAPEYCDYLMTWIQGMLEDENIFPTDGSPFPKTHKSTIKTIFKRLFRVYAHIYFSHAQEIVDLGIEAHLNTAFKHFYLFIKEFDLVSSQELAPLQSIIDRINTKTNEKDEEEKNQDEK